MTWLLPWALGAAAAAALAAGVLHLLARDRPPRWLLPTARFVAAGHARATRRTMTPRDRLLLALRVLALLLAGAAFAGPVLHPEGGSVARVVVLDRTQPASRAAALDSARARVGAGDRLVLVDSFVGMVAPGRERQVLDSLAWADSAMVEAAGIGGAPPQSTPAWEPPTMSAALVAAVRAAASVAPSTDSVGLTIVAAAPRRDAALVSVRALWPGRADVVTIPIAVADSSHPGALLVRGAVSDAVVAGARLAGARLTGGRLAVTPRQGDAPTGASPSPAGAPSARGGALLVRGSATAGDSAFAARGGMLLVWPVQAPDTATTASRRDTVGGFVMANAAVIFRTVRSHVPPPGRSVAHWIDGAPAVTEMPHGAGCIRTAAIGIPGAGDLTLRPSFQRAIRQLLAPCGVARTGAAMRDSLQALLAGSGPLAPAGVMRAPMTRSPATPWLLAAALVLLLLEPLLRRPRREPAGSP